MLNSFAHNRSPCQNEAFNLHFLLRLKWKTIINVSQAALPAHKLSSLMVFFLKMYIPDSELHKNLSFHLFFFIIFCNCRGTKFKHLSHVIYQNQETIFRTKIGVLLLFFHITADATNIFLGLDVKWWPNKHEQKYCFSRSRIKTFYISLGQFVFASVCQFVSYALAHLKPFPWVFIKSNTWFSLFSNIALDFINQVLLRKWTVRKKC